MAALLHPELAVDGAAFEQQAVRRDVNRLAPFQNEDLITVDQRRQAMRDDYHRAAARDAKQISVQQRLALRIERVGRLVQDQDSRIADQCARNRKSLPLPA